MVEVNRELAERISDAARLLEGDESDTVLQRLTQLGVELVPGATAAALTIEDGEQALTFATSDPRIGDLHQFQFQSDTGPAVEALRHNEPRRVDDMTAEKRWPDFCATATRTGFGSCLMLPLRTDRRPAGVVSLYGRQSAVFRGASHDLALLFAGQGGAAIDNVTTYQACHDMVSNLHTALRSRAVIEQAKGIVHAQLGVSTEEAFTLLNWMSQDTNRKVRVVAADVVRGEITSGQLRSAARDGRPARKR